MAELFENLPFENLYWSQMETLPLSQLHSCRLARLQQTAERVRDVPMYRRLYGNQRSKDGNFDLSTKVKNLSDIVHFPFTTVEMLREYAPYDYQYVPRHEIARIQTQNGVVTAFTRRDLQTQADLAARFLYADGVRSNNSVQISLPFGRSGIAFALQNGLELIGTAVVPASSEENRQENLREKLDAITFLGVNGLCDEAERVWELGETAKNAGIPLRLRYAHVPADAASEALRTKIQTDYSIKTYQFLSLPAFYSAGIASECYLQDGMHLQEDVFLFECIDSTTLQPVPDGTPGELVVTDLYREAQPLLRFRTGIQVVLNSKPCPCGRIGRRMKIVQM